MVLNFQKGFTLIELIVSVGIVGVLAVSALVNLSNIKDKKSISSEADEIKTQIERARVLALNPSADLAGYNYFGVIVNVNAPATDTYQLVARKKSAIDITDEKSISTFSLTTTSSLDSDKSIFFGVKEQGRVVNRSSDESFELSKAGLKRTISVSYPFGVVEIR